MERDLASARRIRQMIQRGEAAEAIRLLEASPGLQDFQRHLLHGLANIALGDPQAAIQQLRRARAADPTDPSALHHLGRAHILAKEFGKAVPLFVELCAAVAAPDERILKDAHRAVRGHIEALLASPLVERLQEFLAGAPAAWSDFPEVRFARGHAALARARAAEARSLFEGLVIDFPDELRYRRAAAQAALAQADLPGATGALREVVVRAPADQDSAAQFGRLAAIARADHWRAAVVAPRARLAVCTALKNEGEDVLEWMVYHALVGADRFLLYLNDCTDDTAAQIARFPDQSHVAVHEVHGDLGQSRAYRHAIETYANTVEWCAFIDADEYLVPKDNESLHGLLDDHAGAATIVAHWMIFGSNGHAERPPGLCIEGFTRRAPDDFPDHLLVKSISRMDRIVRYMNPHHSRMLGRVVQPGGADVYPVLGRVPHADHRRLQLNHYYTKSTAQMLRKRARGRPLAASHPDRIRELSFFEKRDRNEVEDMSALRFAGAVRRDMDRLG
jgi:tetratricopeptide (TPR) repeat protein